MKKVLIITYYWPPSGGAGVQRWLKFSKYLPENGWQPIIYTPENPDFSLQDDSLIKDVPKEAIVLKQKIWEPYNLYKKLVGKKGESANAGFFSGDKKSWKQKLSIFIRGNFFIPDPRVFWVKPSVKYLSKYLSENKVDAIVSTGPPHSMHLIALGLKKKFPDLNWLADFRDPWTEIDFYQDLNLSSWADRKHHHLEKEVVLKANTVTTVSDSWAKSLEKNHNREVEVITNGFDPDDFIFNDELNENKTFTILHLGSINKDRNPHVLWRVISQLKQEGIEISVKLIGQIDDAVRESIIDNQLEKNVIHTPYLDHKEALKEASKASVLLLCVNNTPNLKGIIPGKLFEYLALKKPIINIGPLDGDSARIIGETKAGETVDFENDLALRNILLNFISLEASEIENDELTSAYSRKYLTKKIAGLL